MCFLSNYVCTFMFSLLLNLVEVCSGRCRRVKQKGSKQCNKEADKTLLHSSLEPNKPEWNHFCYTCPTNLWEAVMNKTSKCFLKSTGQNKTRNPIFERVLWSYSVHVLATFILCYHTKYCNEKYNIIIIL